MIKFRKMLAIILAAIMCVSLVACAKGNTGESGTSGTVTGSESGQATVDNTSDVTGDTTTEATEEPTKSGGILMPDEPDRSTINSIIPGRITVDGTNFVVNGEVVFMNGANVPWNKWNDFGNGYVDSFWRRHFAELHENGINSVRVWISCDGTKAMALDDDGNFIAATPKHWQDLDKLFAAAEENGIYIMATLMSFDHFKDSNLNSAKWRKMLNSDEAMDSYINNYLIPFCKRYGSYESLWSIDLCNEPDWINENSECGKLPWSKITKFFAKEAAAIHENSDILVTIGFGMIKYNSTMYSGNYGSDKQFSLVYKNDNAYLDFYSTHFYEWEAQWYGFPFDKTPEAFGLDGTKPVVLGEFPATGMDGSKPNSIAMSGSECYVNLYNNGWNGAFAWTSNGVDGCGSLEDFVEGAREVAGLDKE